MIASLPMYATPQSRGAEQRFWAIIRDNLRDSGVPAPDELAQDIVDLVSHWLSPVLVLSQTCSLPYRTKLKQHVRIVGTPDYGVEGCPPGYYCSVIIARKDDQRQDIDAFRAASIAVNDPLSQSGWANVEFEWPWVVENPAIITGSHRASAQAVARGDADFAAIDAITFRHLTQAGETDALRVMHHTPPSPGLPLIAAKSIDAEVVLDCVQKALIALDATDRDMLGLKSIISPPAGAYDLPIPPAPRTNAV